MSNYYYVITCPYSNDDCDEDGYDCMFCPFHKEEDDDE